MGLTVAVTGGIGAGKSTLARRWAERGAVLVDSDRLAREVVAPGTPGLAEVVESFGAGVLAADGALDRAALAGVVFADRGARERLEAIIHPRVRARFAALRDAAPPDAIVVNDMPLLIDPVIAAGFDLVAGVHADHDVRIRRLTARGLSVADARARIAAQIPDDRRRPLCDIWLDNNAAADVLLGRADGVFDQRLVPFCVNMSAHRPAGSMPPSVRDRVELGGVPAGRHGPDRSDLIARVVHRVSMAVGGAPVTPLDPAPGRTGSSSALELMVTAPDRPTALTWSEALAAAGFPPFPVDLGDLGAAGPAGPAAGAPRTVLRCGSADPGLDLYLYVTMPEAEVEPESG